MRIPLQRQILVPLLAIVALTVAGVSAAHAYLTTLSLKAALNQRMRDAARTLAAGTFPLEPNVLRQASQLSGARLAVTGDGQRLIAASHDEVAPPPLAPAPTIQPLPQPITTLDMRHVSEIAGARYFHAVVKLDARSTRQQPRFLHLFYPEDIFRAARWQAVYPSLVVGGIAIVLAVALSGMVALRVTRPIAQLKLQTERIAAGFFDPVPPLRRDDELRDLGVAINRMAALLQANAEELRRHERAATLHQIGAGIAHQLRNAATGCRMALDLFRREHPAARANENLHVAARQLELMESYLQRFLTLGRAAKIERIDVDLNSVAASAVALIRPLAEHLHVKLELADATCPGLVLADRTSLEQVLVNLLTNAVEACAAPPTSEPTVRVAVTECRLSLRESSAAFAERKAILVTVADNGPGLSQRIAGRIGEPFVTTKPEGTGLGIAVAKEIVEQHGGQLTWQRAEGWTRFAVSLDA